MKENTKEPPIKGLLTNVNEYQKEGQKANLNKKVSIHGCNNSYVTTNLMGTSIVLINKTLLY